MHRNRYLFSAYTPAFVYMNECIRIIFIIKHHKPLCENRVMFYLENLILIMLRTVCNNKDKLDAVLKSVKVLADMQQYVHIWAHEIKKSVKKLISIFLKKL